MTMALNRRILILPATIILLFLGIPNFCYSTSLLQNIEQDVLQNVRSVLMDSSGHEFSIRWEYSFEGDHWFGDGTLQILGHDYLRLILPYQEILIQKSVIMTRFQETDQVIIDVFDRHNTSNFFSLLLGEFADYSIIELDSNPDFTVNLRLLNETLVGFEELEMSINQNTWLPLFITAKAGEDIKVTIKIIETRELLNVDDLKNTTLRGSEIIDFRE